MTKTDASRLFGQIINYLLLECFPLEEESHRFHFTKIVTLENNEINWDTTYNYIIPLSLSNLPVHLLKNLKDIDLYCRASGHQYPLDMKEFMIGLTAEFMEETIWVKSNVPMARRVYKRILPAKKKMHKQTSITFAKKAWSSLIFWVVTVL